MKLTKAEIKAGFDAQCTDVKTGIALGLSTGLARQKGKTAAQVKEEFFTELASIAFEAGVRYAEARNT